MTYRSIKIEKGTPGYAAVNPNTNICYISYTSSDFIIVINLDKGTIENKIKTNHPKNIVVNNVTNNVYAASADGVYEIDGLTNKSEIINFGESYSQGTVGINYVTNTLYTTCFGSGDTITVIDLTKKSIIDKIVFRKESRFSPDVRLNGIAVDSLGNVFVTDRRNHRIQKFRHDSTFIKAWGGEGSGDGQLRFPFGVAVDSSGNVYVADTDNNRIQKFNNDGTFIRGWRVFVPQGMAVDRLANVYEADANKHCINKYNSNGVFIRTWGSFGTAEQQFSRPFGVAVDSSGNVYVADSGNHRVQKFGSNGTFIRAWGQLGEADGQFKFPMGIAVDSDANVFVGDGPIHRIQKFQNNGNFITKWETPAISHPDERHALAIKSSNISFLEERVFVADAIDNSI